MSTTIATLVDARGLSCPLPIVKAARAIKPLASGELIEVLATDPGARRDVPAWCHSTRNELLAVIDEDGVTHFIIRKR